MRIISQAFSRQALGILCALLLVSAGAGLAQQPPPPAQAPPPQNQPQQPLSQQQLADLVAPIALYPDSLLSQILVAAGYPLEIVEANQWLQQNRGLRGSQLVDAAKQQNWDPSVQALVVFPDVLTRLNSDIRWTTDLGNAFLAQQADVMNAVQTLRQQASQAGKLRSNSHLTVRTETEGGQQAIEIVPADPAVVYVPVYNPAYFWGPPLVGFYPPLFYPQVSFGFGFGGGIYIGSFFGGLGWGGWGWGPSWFGHSVYVNNVFFHHYGYAGFHNTGFAGRSAWAHNPAHRGGVAYSNRTLAARYHGAAPGGRQYAARQQRSLPSRSATAGRQFGHAAAPQRNTAAMHSGAATHSAARAARPQTYRGSVNRTPSYHPSNVNRGGMSHASRTVRGGGGMPHGSVSHGGGMSHGGGHAGGGHAGGGHSGGGGHRR